MIVVSEPLEEKTHDKCIIYGWNVLLLYICHLYNRYNRRRMKMFQCLLSRFVFCNPAYSLTHTQLWANQWERRMISRFHLLSRSPSKTKDTIHIRFTLNARKCTRLTVVICGLVTNDIYWTAIYLDFPNHWSVLNFFFSQCRFFFLFESSHNRQTCHCRQTESHAHVSLHLKWGSQFQYILYPR